jgi:hypothetical protein
VGDLFRSEGLAGVASGSVQAKVSALNRNRIEMTGRAEARDVLISPQFAADSVSASIDMRNGILRLEPVQIRQHDGSIGAAIELALATPAQWQVSAEAHQWPVEVKQVERGAVSVSGETNVTVNLRDRAARGPVRLARRCKRPRRVTRHRARRCGPRRPNHPRARNRRRLARRLVYWTGGLRRGRAAAHNRRAELEGHRCCPDRHARPPPRRRHRSNRWDAPR